MIVLSKDQAAAVRAIRDWFKNAPVGKQTFFLSGYAGTEKTTCVDHAVAELGLKEHQVAYAAYTMKAALLLRRQGLPASTIHRLIYIPLPPSRRAHERAAAERSARRAVPFGPAAGAVEGPHPWAATAARRYRPGAVRGQ